jgi:HK97 family phage major capsid protein
MLNEITLLRVAGNVKFYAEGTRNTAGKHTENAAVSAANDTIVSVTLGGFEFMKVISISKSAQAMSISAFENWIVDMLAGDIARAIDNYIINDATNGISAITFEDSKNQISATADYTYNDIVNLIAMLPAAYDAEAKFLVNKKVLWGSIRGIVDSNKRPIFDPESKTLCGYPVVEDDYVVTTTKDVYLGRWKDIVGNLSQDIAVEKSDQSGFLRGAIDYRGFATFDSKPAKTDGICRLTTKA